MSLHDDLVAMVEAGRATERDVFRALDPAERDQPATDGGWSPKDVQAHLSSWKARQVRRLSAAQRGEMIEPLGDDQIDALNAKLHAAHASWLWSEVDAEAERVSAELAITLRSTDAALLLAHEPLLGGTMGNGPSHALEHLPHLPGSATTARVEALAEEIASIARRGSLPDREIGTILYNLACFHALGGRLDAARGLLPDAFRMRPDIREWADQDTDLDALRPELEALAAQ